MTPYVNHFFAPSGNKKHQPLFAGFVDAPIPYYHSLPIITGVDLFLPASQPPNSRIRLTLMDRGGNGMMQVINVPNWPSTTDRISVQFSDLVQWDDIPAPGCDFFKKQKY